MRYRPIETAPRDGTEIIVKSENYGPYTVKFFKDEWYATWDSDLVIEDIDVFYTQYRKPLEQPTHWLPVPKRGDTLCFCL
jgi:hypothetical protein